MGRHCSCCAHLRHDELNLAVLLHTDSYRTIATRFEVSPTSLKRHERHCLRTSWEKSKELGAMMDAGSLIAKLDKWQQRMEDQYLKADKAGNVMATAAVARVGISAIDSMAHIADGTAPEQLAEIREELAEVRERLSRDQGEG